MGKDYRKGVQDYQTGPAGPPAQFRPSSAPWITGASTTVGRATVFDDGQTLTVVIPTPKSIFKILFLTVWLCGWTMGGIAAVNVLLFGHEPDRMFLLVWCLGWVAGEVSAGYTLFWELFGREVVVARPDSITLSRELFSHAFSVTCSRIDPKPLSFRARLNFSNRNRGPAPPLMFHHQQSPVFFGQGLDKEAASEVARRIEERTGINVRTTGSKWRGC